MAAAILLRDDSSALEWGATSLNCMSPISAARCVTLQLRKITRRLNVKPCSTLHHITNQMPTHLHRQLPLRVVPGLNCVVEVVCGVALAPVEVTNLRLLLI